MIKLTSNHTVRATAQECDRWKDLRKPLQQLWVQQILTNRSEVIKLTSNHRVRATAQECNRWKDLRKSSTTTMGATSLD